MRLLKANAYGDFDLIEFSGSVPPYATLSHTWGPDGEEVTFKDLVENTGKDKPGYSKIRFCGERAIHDDLVYFWVDTCCIDKSSSTELAEAINSMFRWYREAARCYVHLSDVSTSDYDTTDFFNQSAFRNSRWFTRGWTLQELIAPLSVEFFSIEGKQLGDKTSMEQVVHEITGIAVQALRGTPLTEFSVAERFSWAAKRQTTRKEDEAYSLLGIFDIHMPLIYGEGEKAFTRLREEIDKHSNVHTRRELQHWLSPSNVADDLQKYAEDCMSGSCDWLFTNHSMQRFQSSAISTLGRIQGRPGAGKSTAAGFFIKQLLSNRGTIVLYFFCKASDPEKRQSVQVLRTILFQLLRADKRLYPIIEEAYTQSGRTIADSRTEIETALAAAFATITDAPIFIIIDALDECQDAQKLLGWIRKCMPSVRSTIRVLVTSRPVALDVSPDHEIIIDDVQNTAPLIKAYISRRVKANPNLRGSDLGRRIVSELTSAADSLWLYARLMMDEIERLASSALIERQLQTIPRGLRQLYTQTLCSTEQQFSPEQIRFAQQIFLWLDPDDYLPGFLLTGYDGLSYSTLSIILQYVNFGQPVFDPIALAREVCSPLIKIRRSAFARNTKGSTMHGSLKKTSDFELDYVHHTAEQYILESFTSSLTDLPAVLRPRRLRHFHRAATAMWYFSECNESEQYLQSLRADIQTDTWKQSYFDMAYGIWGVLKLSELEVELFPEEINQLTASIHALSDFITSTKCLRWIETAIIVNYRAEYYHLLLNATEALLATMRADTSTLPIWKEFQATRYRFLSTFVYVLDLTGPPMPAPLVNYSRSRPTHFDSEPLSYEILKLGSTYQQDWSDP